MVPRVRRGRTQCSLCMWLLRLLLVLLASCVAGSDDNDTASEMQAWRLVNEQFDWQQPEPNSSVRIVGKGAADAAGNLYFCGSKTYANDSMDDQNLFIARLDQDNAVVWTREVRFLSVVRYDRSKVLTDVCVMSPSSEQTNGMAPISSQLSTRAS